MVVVVVVVVQRARGVSAPPQAQGLTVSLRGQGLAQEEVEEAVSLRVWVSAPPLVRGQGLPQEEVEEEDEAVSLRVWVSAPPLVRGLVQEEVEGPLSVSWRVVARSSSSSSVAQQQQWFSLVKEEEGEVFCHHSATSACLQHCPMFVNRPPLP